MIAPRPPYHLSPQLICRLSCKLPGTATAGCFVFLGVTANTAASHEGFSPPRKGLECPPPPRPAGRHPREGVITRLKRRVYVGGLSSQSLRNPSPLRSKFLCIVHWHSCLWGSLVCATRVLVSTGRKERRLASRGLPTSRLLSSRTCSQERLLCR